MSNDAIFPITGIGASAGGVEALEGFFRGLPSRPGIGLVIVTHLSPTHESQLPEILTRFTALPIHRAEHGMEVLPDTVYLLSADAVLGIEAGRLQLRTQIPGRRERKPIDVFFSALARDRGERAIGIVLSGGDGDGTLGLKAIKERDGLTLAQVADGFGPGHPDMPNSAIATGMVDLALPVDQMGAKLVEFAHGAQTLFFYESLAFQQVLVHANRPVELTAPTEQPAQREVQIDGFRFEFDDFEEGFDGLVGLLVEQEIQATKIRIRQSARFGDDLADVHPRSQPAQREKKREGKQPPEFEFHAALRRRADREGAP
ncbi:MAG: chemotaxis protein CheB [Rhodospirillales bacterium]|nr:chemotaxis protein CheB [Rhodospirillales bacterium]